MRKLLTLLTFLSFALTAEAQTTSVTLQVTDAAAQTWNNGTWTVLLVSQPGAINFGPPFNLVGGGTVPNQSQSGALSGSGGASMTLTPNASITPSGSQWKFTVCPGTGLSAQCFTQSVTIGSGSQIVTLTPPAASVVIPSGGASFPLTSPTANPAATGSLRLASSDFMCWKNFANNGDVCFTKTAGFSGNVPNDTFQLGGGNNGWFAAFYADGTGGTSAVADNGIIRLLSGSTMCWRNAANTANVCFGKTGGDVLQFGGIKVLTTICAPVDGCTGVASPTAHADPQAEGASVYNFVGPGLTGQVKTATNGADPSYKSPGMSGTDVNSATYLVQCDSGTAMLDRGTTLRFITTTPTVTVPDPTAAGCGSNFAFTMVASGVTATVNRTTTAVFNIYGRSGDPTTAATTFNLTTGQYASLSSPDNANWLVRIVPASGGGTPVTAVNTTGLAANVGATPLVTPGANGFYRISCYIVQTQTATTSGTLPQCHFNYTDADSSVAQGAFLTATNSTNGAGQVSQPQASIIAFYAKTGVAITYDTQGYASVGGTPLQYAIHLRLEGPF